MSFFDHTGSHQTFSLSKPGLGNLASDWAFVGWLAREGFSLKCLRSIGVKKILLKLGSEGMLRILVLVVQSEKVLKSSSSPSPFAFNWLKLKSLRFAWNLLVEK